jgi:hypothetical protein
MVDAIVESAMESYRRVRQSGFKGLGFSGWIILIGFALMSIVVLAVVVALVLK